MIYNLTVTANPELRARAVANGSPYYSGYFKFGDKLTANDRVFVGGMYWYRITKCLRNGGNIPIPYPDTFAGAGEKHEYLRIDSTQDDDPTVPPPVPTFPSTYVLTDPSTGHSAEYTFVRVIE